MSKTKKCSFCNKEYKRNPKYSIKQWEQSQFCSTKCSATVKARRMAKDPSWIAFLTKIATGRKQSLETKIKRGILKKGPESHLWKGGLSDNGKGYLKINGKQQYLHRKIVEEFIGRKLRHDEVIHHKDKNRKNNDISNLIIMTASEHTKLHNPRLGTGKKYEQA